MTDPITDMFNRIKNGQALSRKAVDMPCSKLKLSILEVLKTRGLITDYKKRGRKPHQTIRVDLRYQEGLPAISGFKRVSKPGQRIYKKSKDVKKVKNGYGMALISTNKGLMADSEARKDKVGGEVLVELW